MSGAISANPVQVLGPTIAALGALIGLTQFLANRKAARVASARQAHKEYLELCFNNPEFSSTDQYLRKHKKERLADLFDEHTRVAARYLWFLSFMLNSLEQVMDIDAADPEWRKVATDQIRYHHGAIAELWSAWEGNAEDGTTHFGPTITYIVEAVLREDPEPTPPDIEDREELSSEARYFVRELRKKESGPAPWATARWRAMPSSVTMLSLIVGTLSGILLTAIFLWRGKAGMPAQGAAKAVCQQCPPPPPPPPPPPAGTFDLGWTAFAVLGALALVWAGWKLWRKRSIFLGTTLPLGSFAVEAAKPGTVLKLSDNLHNLLAAITLGLAALAALAALARKLPRAFRLPVLAVLVLGPWLIVLFPLRTRFFASLFTQGQVEGYYIAGLSLAAWLGVVLTAWRSARWEQ